MVNPFEPDDDLPFDDDETAFSLPRNNTTLTSQLRNFHDSFDSSTRAILRDCLFRINEEDEVLTFQILCPNDAVRKRLYKRREKVRKTIEWIWPNMDYYAFCIEKNGLQCQVLDLNCY